MEFQFACESCGETFLTKNKLKSHLENHGNPEFCCSVCGNYYLSKRRLSDHKRKAHGDCFQCNVCDSTFKHASSLRNHVSSKLENGNQITSQVCPSANHVLNTL